MRRNFRLVGPIILWSAYLLNYAFLHERLGDGTPVLALLAVAVSGWLWGVAGGLLFSLVGLYLADGVPALMQRGLVPIFTTWSSAYLFKVLAFMGTGAGFGYLRFMQRQIERHQKASAIAQFDPLTGVLNRSAFERRLRVALEEASAANRSVALLFVDLDRFKFVNDTYGHETGDALLREVARLVSETVREGDLVGRLGGDEFTIALLDMRDTEGARVVARSLVRALAAPFVVDGRELHISASVGVSLYPRDGSTVEALTRSADAAMYEVKEGGKNAFNFSSIEMRTRVSRRLELEHQLRHALSEHEFEIAYQPQVELATGRLAAFEALMRWTNPSLGKVSPYEFIPVAEEAGLIGQIGHWLLREACLQGRAWQRSGLEPIRMAVNVSTLQFRQFDFLDTVRGALADSALDPDMLELEMTESVLVKEYELAVSIVRKLARLGVRTALDDFGTGYSSLTYLQRLPIGCVKIDQSFVQAIQTHPSMLDRGTMPIVEAIVHMAHKLGKTIVAEGVETESQRRLLAGIGVDYAQGFHFSRPLEPARAERLLQRTRQADPMASGLDDHEPPGLLLFD